ncbi:ABC transporter permease [Nocardia brasiliensis]|uniref:ABC transporter permease n=1 Tax=Nocardia brasiliensis TaxID=37326 RepID=UPI000A8F7126|nr:ABC transporter permease [Nocardia brasiliensis]
MGGRAGRLIVRRLIVAVPLAGAVSLAVFALAAASPFDPLDAYLGAHGDGFDEAQRAALRERLGLDRSWFDAWWSWLGDLMRGELGTSRSYRQPVAEVLAERLPWSVLLGVLGGAVALVLAAALGAWAGLRRDGFADRIISASAVVLQSVPPFVLTLGAVLVFATTLRWFPASGLTDPGGGVGVGSTARHLVLPAVLLGVTQLPWLVLGLRETVANSLDSDAVTGARARGLPWRVIAFRHVLPVSVAPFFALCGARLPELVVGATVIETVFSWPGVGAATVTAARALDFPLLAALTLLVTAVVLLGNLAADAIGVAIDPRIDADG